MTAAVDGKGPAAMNTHFPDAETVRTVLTLAVRAPSIHNAAVAVAGMPTSLGCSLDPICSCVAPIRTGVS